ncbi:hypothetical protein [Sporomusa malonica]|uniref:hypothetical protein n=1 Tax=Sporomusa malonica TaxID=112901 RepID=UPI00111C4B1A|nr:hypothetical protein [Sporomusa malonica]
MNPLRVQLSENTLRRGQNLEVRLIGGTGPYRLQQESRPPLQLRQTSAANVFLASSIYSGLSASGRLSRGDSMQR